MVKSVQLKGYHAQLQRSLNLEKTTPYSLCHSQLHTKNCQLCPLNTCLCTRTQSVHDLIHACKNNVKFESRGCMILSTYVRTISSLNFLDNEENTTFSFTFPTTSCP